MSRATAIASRHVAYAMHFINDPSAGEPTDEEIERVSSGCVRRPKPEEYAKIRAEVEAWRRYGLTTAELTELEDPTPVWTVTLGDLQRIAGRKLDDDEIADVHNTLSGPDFADQVSSAVTAVLPDGRYV